MSRFTLASLRLHTLLAEHFARCSKAERVDRRGHLMSRSGYRASLKRQSSKAERAAVRRSLRHHV